MSLKISGFLLSKNQRHTHTQDQKCTVGCELVWLTSLLSKAKEHLIILVL